MACNKQMLLPMEEVHLCFCPVFIYYRWCVRSLLLWYGVEVTLMCIQLIAFSLLLAGFPGINYRGCWEMAQGSGTLALVPDTTPPAEHPALQGPGNSELQTSQNGTADSVDLASLRLVPDMPRIVWVSSWKNPQNIGKGKDRKYSSLDL